jgi:hypothetical protein
MIQELLMSRLAGRLGHIGWIDRGARVCVRLPLPGKHCLLSDTGL